VQAAAHAQQDFPSVKLKNTAGKTIDFADLIREAKDTTLVFSFWATWCIPCITELDNISDEYKEKQSSMNFKFYGVSIDDSRTTKRVKPFIQGKGWTFDVMMDVNSELKRALNITDVPHVLIIKNNKIVYRDTGYIAGEEDNLFDEIKKLQ
jgi:peroxiredoxin